jgi:hypothetical protein
MWNVGGTYAVKVEEQFLHAGNQWFKKEDFGLILLIFGLS